MTRTTAILGITALMIAATPSHARTNHHHKHHRHHHHRHHVIDANGVIGGRPAGCPSAYCGCGLAQYLGLNDRRLWLAREWFKFPRTSPHSGAVAVRSHHVFMLKEHIAGNVWTVLDYNSGRHLTRIHSRSIAGFTIVEPSRRYADARQ